MHNQTNKRIFWALDFDRCLGGTQVLYDIFVEVLQSQGIASGAQLKDARLRIEQTGGSFDVISYLYQMDLVDDEVYRQIVKVYLQRAKDAPRSMLEPGAEEFIECLRSSGHSFGILSYGDERWQRLKISASGLGGVSTMITDEKRKGRLIASWYDDTHKEFHLPPGIGAHDDVPYKEVILIDDKAVAFDRLPLAARGYWLQINQILLPSQQGNVPNNVKVVQSFQEIANHEGLPYR